MKILIVSTYASIRSIGKITTMQYRFFKEQGHKVKICYRGIREPRINNPDYIPIAGNIEPYIAKALSMLTGYEGHFHPFATKRLMKITEEFSPDIVQINLLHGYYINSTEYLVFLKDRGFPVFYSMFDEYAYMGKCPFSFDCNKFISGCNGKCPNLRNYPKSYLFDRSSRIFKNKKIAYENFYNIIFAGTDWVVDRAKTSFLLKNRRVEILDEPINYEEVFYPRDTKELKNKLNIPSTNKVIVTVAQLSDPRKGGKYFYQLAQQLKENKNITFVYVGCDAQEPIKLDNLISIPFVKSQDELAEYYSLGDLFVITSLADTTACTCLEALGCGTPLAGFAEAGTPYVAPEPYLRLTKTYDVEHLARIVEESHFKDVLISKSCVQYARSRYSRDVVFNRQLALYQNLISAEAQNKNK